MVSVVTMATGVTHGSVITMATGPTHGSVVTMATESTHGCVITMATESNTAPQKCPLALGRSKTLMLCTVPFLLLSLLA